MKYVRSPQPELFQAARQQLKCSQSKLARYLGVHKSTISRIERGLVCPNHRLIQKLEQLTHQSGEALMATSSKVSARHLPEVAGTTAPAEHLEVYSLPWLRMVQKDKLANIRQQLRKQRTALQSALVHSRLDQTFLVLLQQRSAFLNQSSIIIDEADTDLQEFLNEQIQENQRSIRHKRAYSISISPCQVIHQCLELQQLQQQEAQCMEAIERITATIEAEAAANNQNIFAPASPNTVNALAQQLLDSEMVAAFPILQTSDEPETVPPSGNATTEATPPEKTLHAETACNVALTDEGETHSSSPVERQLYPSEHKNHKNLGAFLALLSVHDQQKKRLVLAQHRKQQGVLQPVHVHQPTKKLKKEKEIRTSRAARYRSCERSGPDLRALP